MSADQKNNNISGGLESFLKPEILAAAVAAITVLKQFQSKSESNNSPFHVLFSNPLQVMVIILSLAGYIYFSHQGSTIARIEEQQKNIENISRQQADHALLMTQMQSVQERIIERLENLRETDKELKQAIELERSR